jgi:hypothetical protein
MPCTIVASMQNPMAHSLSSTLGSSILDECESQIILGPPFLNAWKCGKFKNIGRANHGRPSILNTVTSGQSSWWTPHEWRPGSNMPSIKPVGDLGVNSYACWITFGGARLVHIHQNQWACEPIEATSTLTILPIQALICYHLAKIVGLKSPNGGTFSNKYAHGCICDCYKCCTTWINS